ncbi:MAG: aminotransferase class V-fold PLP-dependent enzyme, partial [Acidobacteria bacterium]|nr:aminotransferase class V-fold PLP-dependent enzyme [Acidobacteriota bacterium]
MTDWAQVRDQEFPALRHWTYLNTATYGQMPRRAVSAMDRHNQRREDLACSDYLSWFDDADEIRASIARLVHSEAGDIAFFQNASSALSTLVNGLEWKPGDRVLTFDDEFPNHLYWGAQLATRGVHFDIVPYTRFAESLTPRTRLVMVSTVNYSTGLLAPVQEMARQCRENGTVFYIDGTQSMGALEFDFAA